MPDVILTQGASTEAEVVTETGQCLKPLAVTVEKSVKYPLGPQAVNLCIAVIVLRKWAEEGLIPQGQEGLILELQVLIKAKLNLML